MRKGLREPESIDELKERVRAARMHLFLAEQHPRDLDYRYTVERRVPMDRGYPAEAIAEMQAELDRRREKLSARVSRIYERRGQIAIVCDLIRRSPVFLREAWINDVILVKRKVVVLDRSPAVRQAALSDLRELAKAILSERARPPAAARSARQRLLSALRPPQQVSEWWVLEDQYLAYLEIAICLKCLRPLAARPNASPVAKDRFIGRWAGSLGVPEEWLAALWQPQARRRDWVLSRLAEMRGATKASIRRDLEQAREGLARAKKVALQRQEARARLDLDRFAKATARARLGGGLWTPRTY